MSYTQFKLSSGEEIIAEVIDEPEGDDYNIVIRRAMIIHKVEDKQNIRYYSFRPWMTYQLDKDYLQLLNYNHIIGEAKPDELLLEQYMKALGFETKGDEILGAVRPQGAIPEIDHAVAHVEQPGVAVHQAGIHGQHLARQP